jgi:membrane protein
LADPPTGQTLNVLANLYDLLKRTVKKTLDDGMTDWAAALTYYGLLALFPALIAMVSIVGLFADPVSTSHKITEIVTQLGPESGAKTFQGPINSITANQSAAGVLFVVGLALSVYAASGYVGAFARASNVIYEVEEGRSTWKLKPVQMLIALGMVIIVALLGLALVLTGPVVSAVAQPLGVGSTATDIWNFAKWPVLLIVALLLVDVLYYSTPNVRLRGFRWVTPGSALAVGVWLVVSGLFASYVANFGSYDKTYGTLGGIVVLLVWMWITNVALLLGQALNAERERTAQLEEGVPEERTLEMQPREAASE